MRNEQKVIVRYEHIVTSQANLLVWEPTFRQTDHEAGASGPLWVLGVPGVMEPGAGFCVRKKPGYN